MRGRTGIMVLVMVILAVACSGGAPSTQHASTSSPIIVSIFDDGQFAVSPDFRQLIVDSYQPSPPPAPSVGIWYYRWMHWQARLRHLQPGDDVQAVKLALEYSYWFYVADQDGLTGLAEENLPTCLELSDQLNLIWFCNFMAKKETEQ